MFLVQFEPFCKKLCMSWSSRFVNSKVLLLSNSTVINTLHFYDWLLLCYYRRLKTTKTFKTVQFLQSFLLCDLFSKS